MNHLNNQSASLPMDAATAIAALPVPMLVADECGKIILINQGAEALLGARAKPGENMSKLLEGLGQSISQWITSILAGTGSDRAEVLSVSDRDIDRFVQVSMRPLPGGDGEPRVIVTLNDAKDIKSLEAQVIQAQKMQVIGKLAGGIAHDFNNLLTAISGHCDLMFLRTSPEDEGYEDLVQINKNAHRAAGLVGQLLAFSRKQMMLPEQIDVSETLQKVSSLLNRIVGTNIKLITSMPRNAPRIMTDKRHIEQILMNLIINARDAMPEGGIIRVSVAGKKLDCSMQRSYVTVPKGDYVVITVTDEGVGIPADRLHQIFEPFFTTKRVGEGTGLGLSTVYGMVKQSGGFIFVDSQVGKGTTFTLFFRSLDALPEEKPIAPPAIKKSADDAPKKVQVLLAEDEDPVRAFAARALELNGMEVSQAASGEEALDFINDPDVPPFDLYLSDVVMPGLDGPEWVLKALERFPGTPVVFMSGYTQEAFAERRAAVGRSAFVPKPFSLSDLNKAIQDELAARLPPAG